jgi:hypothetical protein
LQELLDQKECKIKMVNKNFKRDITILMTDQNVQFKVKTLIICKIESNQVHIIDWLLLKSPNIIELQILDFRPIDNFDRGLEI